MRYRRRMQRRGLPMAISSLALLLGTSTLRAEMGAPPPDPEALVAELKGPADVPKLSAKANDSTNVTLSAGGLLTTGNSRTLALTLNGAFDMRRGNNGFGAFVLGNYGESAPEPGAPMEPSAENIQGRIRYDRYIGERLSVFLIATGRYDKFQGLAFRLNLDPGFKFIIFKSTRTALWAEAGYDFQYDLRTEEGRRELDGDGNPTGAILDKTRTDHSARLFGGLRHAFSQDITFSTGIEYLQSFIRTDLGPMNSRINFNAVLAAKIYKGFSLGVGFNAAYDRLPIPGREQLDTTTTMSLIYGWASPAPKKDEKPKCPVCPEIKVVVPTVKPPPNPADTTLNSAPPDAPPAAPPPPDQPPPDVPAPPTPVTP